MRNKDRVDAKGVARSQGFGFIAFDQHDDALLVLNALNNSTVFGPKNKPIVEVRL